MVKIVNDNHLYARLVKLIKRRALITEETITAMSDILGDEEKAKEVVEASKSSMGTDISDIDMVCAIPLFSYQPFISYYLL